MSACSRTVNDLYLGCGTVRNDVVCLRDTAIRIRSNTSHRYHSHFAIQTWEGVFGPVVIDGPSTQTYDQDLGTLFLQDWSHLTVDELYPTAENAAIDPVTNAPIGGPQTMDNGLLNGKNTWGSSNSTNSTQ